MKKKKILIATAFPTHGAGSGALVTTQAKSYVEDGHQVHIITGNNRTNFDKLPGVQYHIVPFTAETENAEKIEGQVPFNYLMFTTHTESTANFWNASLSDIEEYCRAFKQALISEIDTFNPDIIHAQHNWLLSSAATEMGKPVVTTIHGTDLMGYEKSKAKLEEVKIHIAQLYAKAQTDSVDVSVKDLNRIEEVYKRSTTSEEINREIGSLLKSKAISMPKATLMHYMQVFDDKRKYEFYIAEAEKSARKSQKIIVISDAQKEKFMSLFPFAKDKVELLENGYDPKIFYVDPNVDKEETFAMLSSDRAENGKISTDYDTLVLFVGKFADFKGIDSLLTAAKQYEEAMQKENNKPLTLIVGSGALEPKLKAQADQLQLKNTHFVGRHQHDMICKLQNLADVSVIPSRDEPFGLVVIEGTACGHPVIGSNSGGITGILNTSKKPLPMQDIIQTPLGVLIKPLPNRPKDLTENQLDLLDRLTTDYVVAEDDARQQILKDAQAKLGIPEETLGTYFMEYAQSTNALSASVLKIANHELTFDNSAIHDYTEQNYSQDIIRDKLINIFDEAESIYAKEAKSHED